jgi:aminoglycoside phosphotransferase (APT) family kinase protein
LSEANTLSQEEFLARLRDYLTQETGEDVHILSAKPLAGGASRDTWMFTATIGGREEHLVLRKDLPTQMFDEALTRRQEYYLMDAAYKSGVRVAQMRFVCNDESILGNCFFIMNYVQGISIGSKVMRLPELEGARQRLPEQMAEQLALIHKMDWQAHDLEFLAQPSAQQSAHDIVVEQCYSILDELGVQNATWEWVLRWAEKHKPTTSLTTMVHGDFRIGNLLVDESGLTAVIDWEFGHIGDPDEEIGYACMRDWRFGNGQNRFAGLTDRESFLAHYERYSGRTVNRAHAYWWEVMGNIRWGIICMSQANRHLSGAEQSVELASLGRRSAEMQLETLRLIRMIESA